MSTGSRSSSVPAVVMLGRLSACHTPRLSTTNIPHCADLLGTNNTPMDGCCVIVSVWPFSPTEQHGITPDPQRGGALDDALVCAQSSFSVTAATLARMCESRSPGHDTERGRRFCKRARAIADAVTAQLA